MNLDLIRKLQKNTTPLGLLSKEEQECLRENNKLGHVQYYNIQGCWQGGSLAVDVNNIAYRIDPDWNPSPEPAEWIRDGFEVCEIKTFTAQDGTEFLGIVRNGVAIRLSMLIDLPDFVGGVFEEQPHFIFSMLRALWSTNIGAFCYLMGENDEPVTAKWAVFSK